MSRYDGLIIPRSYSEYINKTDAATLQQALQLSGVLSDTVVNNDNKAVKSIAVFNALKDYAKVYRFTPSEVGRYLLKLSSNNTQWNCILMTQGKTNYATSTFLLQGYGATNSRNVITKLTTVETNVTVEPSPEELEPYGVIINIPTTNMIVDLMIVKNNTFTPTFTLLPENS